MWRYVARRLLQMVPVLIGTTLLIYLAVFALPGDPIRVLGGDKPMPPAVYQALRHHYHLDEPLIVQYGKYLWGLVQGDFGETLNGQPVSDVMKTSWTITAQLALTAWIFELVVGMALGVWAGPEQGRRGRHAGAERHDARHRDPELRARLLRAAAVRAEARLVPDGRAPTTAGRTATCCPASCWAR